MTGTLDAAGTAAGTAACPPALPYSGAFVQDPYPVYAWYRDNAPVASVEFPNSPRPVWWVTRYTDVRAVLTDPRFSSDLASANASTAATHLPLGDPSELSAGSMSLADGSTHARRRRLVARALTPSRMEALTRRIERTAVDLLRRMAARPGGRADFVEDFAAPLPSIVLTEFLGVQFADREVFQNLLGALVSVAPEDAARVADLVTELIRYTGDLIEHKRAHFGDDLVSALIRQCGEDGEAPVSSAELLSIVFEIQTGGYETARNLLAGGVLALLDHPDQLALLRETPEAAGAAVEELLRYVSPAQSTLWRFPTRDVELAGTVIPAGDPVLPLLASANRDPEKFTAPDRLDLRRENVKHLSYGGGAHGCPGAALSRIEARIALPLILDALPDLRLAVPRDALRYRPAFMARSLERLPIEYSASEYITSDNSASESAASGTTAPARTASCAFARMD